MIETQFLVLNTRDMNENTAVRLIFETDADLSFEFNVKEPETNPVSVS